MPLAIDPIVALDAEALSRAIHARQISCREVMQAYLAHIERFNPQVNALVSLRPAEALLAEADERDRELGRGHSRGWMHGMPQAIKDLAATAGLRTTLGSPLFAEQVPEQDAISVARVRASGALIVGKSNVPEFGLGSQTYNTLFGTTTNAYDPGKVAGGSSGGAAAALAMRLLPVADGSDMMGSLRNPAAFNNVYGLRPSQGRVPHGPAPELFVQQLATEGPMGRSVVDVARLLSTQAGFDVRAPLSLGDGRRDFAAGLQRDFRGVRVGWLGDYDGYLAMDDGVLSLCEAALADFAELGCRVEACQPAFDMARLWQCWLTHRHFLVHGNLAAAYADPGKRAAQARGAVGGGGWPATERGGGVPGFGGPQRLVPRAGQAVRALRLPAVAIGPGVPIRCTATVANGGRRAGDGHLSPLDGSGDWADPGRLAEHQRTGRFQRCWVAHGPADHRPGPGRPCGVAAGPCP